MSWIPWVTLQGRIPVRQEDYAKEEARKNFGLCFLETFCPIFPCTAVMGFSCDTKAHLRLCSALCYTTANMETQACHCEQKLLLWAQLSSRATELKPLGLSCIILNYRILIPSLYLFFFYALMTHIACSNKSVGVFLPSQEFCQLKILFTHMIILFWVRLAVRNEGQTTLSGCLHM